MIRPLALAAALLLTAAQAGAVVPRPGPGDPRIHVVDFDPAEVVELRSALGFQLSVEFDAGEKIENVAIGDSLGWQETCRTGEGDRSKRASSARRLRRRT